jgi:hypothetical protein
MTEADDLDRASDLTLALNDSAIEEVRRAARPEQVVGPDGKWPQTTCEDCEERIPAARLKLGKIRCIHCQGVLERRRAGL